MTPSVVDITLLAALLLATAYAVLVLVFLVPKTRALGKDMLHIMLSATLIAGLICGSFVAGGLILWIALILLGFRIGYETGFVTISPQKSYLTGSLLAASTAAITWFSAPQIIMVLITLWSLCLMRHLWAYFSAQRTDIVSQILLFPLLPFLLFAHAAGLPDYAPFVLGSYLLVETFDGYALVAGKLFGRTKAFPTLSPGKTVEGLAGGAVMLVLTAMAAAWALGLPMVPTLLLSLLVGVLTVAGDLAASRLKRQAGVKDYPVLMARQGGALDSLDSWVAAGAGLGAVLALYGVFG